MKKIYIIQDHTGTFPSKVIKILTKYQYSHILLSLDTNFDKMYSFGRRTLYNPLNAGFVIESINSKFFKRFNNTECRVYELTITDRKYCKLKKLLYKFEKNPEMYQYDIIGLLLKIFNIQVSRKNHYVCSQFVGEIIEKSDIHKFNKKFETIKPCDFDNLPNSNLLYVGNIKYISLEM